MKPKRSLVTILFTDIVGSTKRAAELRDAGWRDVRNEHDRRVRRELRRFDGHEINTAGDSFLATFTSPARAITCADAIRSAVHDLGLEIRAGLHMGELERGGHDLGGLAVHIGARVAAEAGPGEILVSRSVHDALAGSAFDFEDRGVRELKGAPGEWRLFAATAIPVGASEALPGWFMRIPFGRRQVVLGGAVAVVLVLLTGLYLARRELGSVLITEEALAINAAPGIAVLPFTVQGAGLDVWREGMVDVLSTNLDGTVGLRTIDSRTVLARWREGVPGERAPDLASALDVARRTGASYALVGDVVGSSTRVRFGAEVYDLEDGSKLGRGQVEGSPDSIFSLVDRLSVEVLRAIYQKGGRDLPQMPVLESVTTASLPALKAYLLGEVLYRSGDFKDAVAAYERAIAADSLFALAIMRIGDAGQWIPPYDSSVEYYERALKLSDRLPAREALLAQANRDYLLGTMTSLDSLRQAVQQYPDDPDFWHLLGETYYHLPYRKVTEDEADRVFSRALALDPYFAHYYLHPMDLALFQADSARSATLLEAYLRIAPQDDENTWIHRVAHSLAFGDSGNRTRALEALDTLPITPAAGLITILSHPRFGRIQEQSFRRILARPDEPPPWLLWFLFVNQLNRGQFRAALGNFDDEPSSFLYAYQPFMAYLLIESGMTLPPERIERDLSGDGNPEERNAFFAGAYAADRGRWPAHDAAVRMLHAEADRFRASGDSLEHDSHEDGAKALQAYGQWKRGHGVEALPILEAIEYADPVMSWWLGELSLELGKRREAALYFGSIWGYSAVLMPLAAFHLGGIYNDLGEFEKARESYEYALLAWQDADPEMQPRIEVARQALARLPKLLRRESQ